MRDRLFFPVIALTALAMVVIALVWPQGLGDRSPGPFGHVPTQRTPAVQAAMQRETKAANQRVNQARQAVSDLQSQAIAPTQ
ncbi:hypothetical protein JKL49_18205 [Phenylobacterium sp. 20VBR1]|uniref:Uncharacterized protein n=1 Tax=Phenylobacterium glaciei TaxID=2803784 RepID=A0A941HYF3_9CAUL|nr:hypothetical protein [Phenylobacterium glaciei]MBR7621332.1 hypothetical protein [Phenylobacterium glaciei]